MLRRTASFRRWLQRSVPGGLRSAALVASWALALSDPLAAALCAVPGTHADLRCAIGDLTCSEITLAAGTFIVDQVAIDRDLVLHGTGPGTTTLAGRLTISGPTSDVEIANLRIDATGANSAGCAEAALSAIGGANLQSSGGLEALDAPPTGSCRIFADGFEVGGPCVWSFASP